jgi:hypothetical protein
MAPDMPLEFSIAYIRLLNSIALIVRSSDR